MEIGSKNTQAGMDLLVNYYPKLNALQRERFGALHGLYEFWNQQINVISRKDIDLLYERHILHSMAIGKFIHFQPQAQILDVGTGGGFPGIPLAILFPEVSFHLVDSIGKKIKVVREIAKELGLTNVEADHIRAEQVDSQYDFVVSRAVTRLSAFYPWVSGKFKKQDRHALPNGIIYLKGGDLKEELAEARLKAQLHPLSHYFKEPFFETKYIVYIPV